MKTERRFIRNITSNTGGFLLSVVIAFFLSPFVVHTLGDKIFGLWTLVVSLKGYYGLLDLGIRSAVGQYATRHYARQDIHALNCTMNTALAAICAVVVLIMAISGIVAWGAPQWFDLAPDNVPVVRLTIIITGLTVALTFPAALFGVAMYARQRFDLQNIVAGLERLIMAGLTVFVLKAGFGIIGLAAVGLITSLLAGIANVVLAFRLLEGLRIAPEFVSMASFKELWHYGIFNSVINVADQIITNLDAIVIGIFMAEEDITYYAIGANLIPYYIALVNAIAYTITPYATALDATGEKNALKSLWLNSSRGIIMFAALIAGGLFFVGEDFLKMWMGERFVDGANHVSSADVLKILALAALIRLGMTSGKQMCFAMRRVKFLAYLTLAESCLNVLLSCILVQKFGVLGVSFGTLLPILIVYGIIMPMFIMNVLHVSFNEVLLHVPWGGATILGVMGLLSVGTSRYFPAESWPSFLLKAGVFAAPAVIAGLLTGTTRAEKHAFFEKLRTRYSSGR